MKRWFRGLTSVKTFLLLTTQPRTWLTALQKHHIRGIAVDTTLFSTKHSKTGRLAKRDIRTFFCLANTFRFHSNKQDYRQKKKMMLAMMLACGKICSNFYFSRNMFWFLTVDCDVLRCFHCWVVNKRAFVYTSGVT